MLPGPWRPAPRASGRGCGIPRRGFAMFNKGEMLREANRHVVESRQRVAVEEARAAELVRTGHEDEAITLLEECRDTLRLMERHREVILARSRQA